MKVLLVNAFHHPRGGVERTYLDESRWLAGTGHEVAHFAVRHPRNLPSPTAAQFAPAAEFGEGTGTARLLAQLPRALWSAPAEHAMEGLLAAFRPDVAHLHAPSRYLTPSVLRPLERAGVPMVMTLHDFKPWCTNRILFARGAPCQRCGGGRHWQALATGCVQDSRAKSAVGMLEAYLHDALGAYRAVRRWIAPSRFALERAASLGAPRERLRLLPHALESPTAGATAGAPLTDAPFALFAGRLSAEKGAGLLPALARELPVPLLVAGEGPLADRIAREAPSNLRLVGQLAPAELAALRSRAVAVMPSLSEETFGYTAAEALLDARPVVASDRGALPELVRHEVTGLTAPPDDPRAFAAAVRRALEDGRARGWGEAGREQVLAHHSAPRHLEGLLAIYEEARAAR
jgi:glycosyltransferase involved in cell wall biosynthesis